MASAEAQKAKDQGNTAFKSGKFPDAIGHYTAAILADSSDPTYPLNRAAAYLKLGKNEDAERDCTTVLRLKPGHVKGLFRRAQARAELKKWDDAQRDLNEALKAEPHNEAIKTELTRIEELKSKAKLGGRSTVGLPEATVPQRRRVPIEIVEPDTSVVATSQTPDNLVPISSRSLSSPSPSAVSTPSTSKPSHVPSTAKPGSPKASERTEDRKRPTVAGGIFRASGSHTVVRSPSPTANKRADFPLPVTRVETPPISQNVQEKEKKSPPADADITHCSPMSLFTFTKAWETSSTPVERWNLITQIPAPALPCLFQVSLEAPLLVSILETFQSALADRINPTVADSVKDYVAWFPKVSRFQIVLLFMSAEEKELARSVCSAVGGGADWQI